MMIAAAELRKRSQDHSREFQVTARRLADFVASVEAEESLLIQRLQDAAARNIRRVKDSASEIFQDDASPSDGNSLPQPKVVALQTVMAAAGFMPPPELYEEY
jgi:hypothetical protein